MQAVISGRDEELKLLNKLRKSDKSAFVAIYGRRRVGKTFLVRTCFEGHFAFQHTGLANAKTQQQLHRFHDSLARINPQFENSAPPQNWFKAFDNLVLLLEKLDTPKKIIFIDELPWLDTQQSSFISALEHFWNSWASARRDILLITCGSAASWMVNNLLNNHGGLHNRVTHRMRLEPFTLAECEHYFKDKMGVFDRYHLVQLYMAFGGIPFYLEQVDTSKSAAQNINDLCFTPNGALREEFSNLYASLFKKEDRYVAIIEALAQKGKGLTREELCKIAKIPAGGSVTRILNELEESSFIRRYPAFGKLERNHLYQLCDFFSLFHLRFIKNSSALDKNTWINSLDSPGYHAWSGYAFEQVCLAHLDQIKEALGISGIQTNTSAWIGEHEGEKAQIDLVIDRRDQVINLFEMKFSIKDFSIDKSYAEDIRRKISIFKANTRTRKAIFFCFMTTFGLQANAYSSALVQKELKMDDFFR
jgi:uncharacterized protein